MSRKKVLEQLSEVNHLLHEENRLRLEENELLCDEALRNKNGELQELNEFLQGHLERWWAEIQRLKKLIESIRY